MYDQEFYSDLEKFNKEYYKNKLIYESVHPIDIINENTEVLSEAFGGKVNMAKLIADIIYKMQKALNKFINMTAELIKRNAKIVQTFNKVNLNLINFDGFEYEIHDIRTAMNNIKKVAIPNFSDGDMDLLLTNNGLQYKLDKFPGMFSEDGQINKDYFNGTVKSENGMMKVTGNSARDMYKSCLEVLNTRDALTKKLSGLINNQRKLVSSVTKNVTVQEVNSESALYDASIFKDEYIDILLEDAVTTPNDIKQEDNNEQKGINNDPEQSKTNNDNSRRLDAIIKFNEIAYSVESTIMSSLDSLYGEAIKFCSKVTQLSNKNNK